jgi:3-hydroxybutyryl-CoA dehydrogenase
LKISQLRNNSAEMWCHMVDRRCSVLLDAAIRNHISAQLQAAIFRESLALAEVEIATPHDIDRVITSAIGRRWSIGGPFEIWEQIGWDLVEVIAGELFKEISNSDEPPKLPIMTAYCENKAADGRVGEVAHNGESTSPRFGKIAVIGAGLMGHGIALEFAAHGRDVILYDISEDLLANALDRARVGLLTLSSIGRISRDDVDPALGRIHTAANLPAAVSDADLVIEAASENLKLKQQIFSEIDSSAPLHAILASNSSTFVPSAYASATTRHAQIIGIHYFNPPHLLPGVEIVKGPGTSGETTASVASEYEAIGKKTAIIRHEIPGFVANRLQVALLREAMSIVEGGSATAPQIDEIVRNGFGKEFSKIGIFEMAARDGVELAHTTAREIFPRLATDRGLPRLLLDKIKAGDLGVKSGKGFYEWTPESAEAWRKNMADSLLNMTARG